MPRKSKNKSLLLERPLSTVKSRRGRPRKAVAPEALLPFGKPNIASTKQTTSLKKNISTVDERACPNKQRMNPATSDRNYTQDEVEFMNALAEFKRTSGRLFPTCSEILAVLRDIGYEKTNRE